MRTWISRGPSSLAWRTTRPARGSDLIFLLDTNTCIFALKGRHPAIERRMRGIVPGQLKIPSIVEAELRFGAEKSDRRERSIQAIDAFLSPFEIVPFGGDAPRHYARVRAELERRGRPIGANDLIIAATTLAIGATLVSSNLREFRRVRGLPVEDWAK